LFIPQTHIRGRLVFISGASFAVRRNKNTIAAPWQAKNDSFVVISEKLLLFD
jgi:hypothetical protein